jgi:hypothetical protein
MQNDDINFECEMDLVRIGTDSRIKLNANCILKPTAQ